MSKNSAKLLRSLIWSGNDTEVCHEYDKMCFDYLMQIISSLQDPSLRFGPMYGATNNRHLHLCANRWLQYLHCYITGDNAVLHSAIDMFGVDEIMVTSKYVMIAYEGSFPMPWKLFCSRLPYGTRSTVTHICLLWMADKIQASSKQQNRKKRHQNELCMKKYIHSHSSI